MENKNKKLENKYIPQHKQVAMGMKPKVSK